MSENATENAGVQASQESAQAESQAQDATDWKAEARKWEARAKSNLSDLEQTRSALATTETAAQQAQRIAEEREAELHKVTALRAKEALLVDAGLPRDLAPNVVGDDEEAWQASVERFASLRAPSTSDRRPDPAQAASVETDPRAVLAEQIFGS